MQIREMSDIHNEFGVFNTLPMLEGDKERVLILAGDIDAAPNAQRNYEWINFWGDHFKAVIYIAGNHEFYHGDYDDVISFYKTVNWKPNVHFLNHDSVTIDGVYFWCGTLWTGLQGGKDWGLLKRIERGMNDFRLIQRCTELKTGKRNYTNWSPLDMVELFEENKPKLFEGVEYARKQGMKTVVVTHHAPCSPSIAKHYRGHDMNEAYCSYIDDEVLKKGPDLWFHGHTHVSNDYTVGKTRVICNPRGYHNYEENSGFNPSLVVEI